MIVMTAAEHFSLSSQTKSEIESLFSSLDRLLPDKARLRLHFKKGAHQTLEGTLYVHARHEDFAYTESSGDIRTISSALRDRLERRLIAHKEKRMRDRKKRRAFARQNRIAEPIGA